MSASDYLAIIRAREQDQADELGMTLGEYRAHVASEIARSRAEDDARSERARRRMVAQRVASRMPPETLEALVNGTLENTRALEAVSKWMGSQKAFCLLLGGTGVGKTVAAMYAFVARGGEFVRSSDLGPALDPWKGDREMDRVRANSHGVFVLDDLGIERADDARWAVCFDDLVDARQGLRTVITSNLTPQQIAERYSERARDRIRASCVVVTLTGKSMRGGK